MNAELRVLLSTSGEIPLRDIGPNGGGNHRKATEQALADSDAKCAELALATRVRREQAEAGDMVERLTGKVLVLLYRFFRAIRGHSSYL